MQNAVLEVLRSPCDFKRRVKRLISLLKDFTGSTLDISGLFSSVPALFSVRGGWNFVPYISGFSACCICICIADNRIGPARAAALAAALKENRNLTTLDVRGEQD